MAIKPIKLSRSDYWQATKRYYWSLAMSSLRWKGRSFKQHEAYIFEKVPEVLSEQENEILGYQLSKLISVERFHGGRFVRLHTDRRYPVLFANCDGKQTLAIVQCQQGKAKFKAIIETWDGHLWGLSFKGGKFDSKQPFEVLSIQRYGKGSTIADALDRLEHGRGDHSDP